MPHNEQTDETALRRDELILALQARERFLDAILGSLEVFFTVDEDWRLTYVNRAAATMAGASAEDLVGRDLWRVMSAEFNGVASVQLRRAMAERVSVDYDVEGVPGVAPVAPGVAPVAYHSKAYPLADGGLAVYVRDTSEARSREREREELFAALEQSEQSFSAVFEASPFALSLTEMPSGLVLRVNRAFEDLLGFSREELVGRTSPQLGISDAASQAEVARRFSADGVVRDHEVERTTKGGERRTLSINLDWVTVGRRRAVLTSIHDVTEQRIAERALRDSEQRYRSIVETTGDGILIGRPDGTISFVNRRMADMLGYAPEELVDKPGLELVFPDWQPQVMANRSALGDGEVIRGEFKLQHKDGSSIWTMFSSAPMVDEAGNYVGNLTIHSDISHRKAAEEALRLSEERFRLVLAATPVSVAAQDADLRYVWAYNQRTAPAGGVIGLTDTDVFQAEEAEHLLAIKQRVLDEGVELHEQLWLDRPQGRVYLDVTFSPLRDESGAVTGVGVTTVDMTQAKLAEEALREREIAEAAQEERARLARDLHDSVTQALFAVSLKAEALSVNASAMPPEVAADVEDVRRLSHGALAQMRSMLLELRGDPLEEVPLPQLLRNLVEATESRVSTAVDLTIDGTERLAPPLHVALYRITQEALNNVARHAQADGAWVDLKIRPTRVTLSVRDDGRGFDPAPLGPAHMGLRFMRERAEEVGAKLRVVSGPGEGTLIAVEWRGEPSEGEVSAGGPAG